MAGEQTFKGRVVALQACQASQAVANVPCQASAPDLLPKQRVVPARFNLQTSKGLPEL